MQLLHQKITYRLWNVAEKLIIVYIIVFYRRVETLKLIELDSRAISRR